MTSLDKMMGDEPQYTKKRHIARPNLGQVRFDEYAKSGFTILWLPNTSLQVSIYSRQAADFLSSTCCLGGL